MADRTKRLDRTLKRAGRSSGLQLSEFESGSGREVPLTRPSQRTQDSEFGGAGEAARTTPGAISIDGRARGPNGVACGRIIGAALEGRESDCGDNSNFGIRFSRPGSIAQERAQYSHHSNWSTDTRTPRTASPAVCC